MATCNPQTLLSTDPCFVSLSPFLQQVVIASMLCNLVEGDPVTCDVQELLDQGKCFEAMPLPLLNAAVMQLICDLSSP